MHHNSLSLLRAFSSEVRTSPTTSLAFFHGNNIPHTTTYLTTSDSSSCKCNGLTTEVLCFIDTFTSVDHYGTYSRLKGLRDSRTPRKHYFPGRQQSEDPKALQPIQPRLQKAVLPAAVKIAFHLTPCQQDLQEYYRGIPQAQASHVPGAG